MSRSPQMQKWKKNQIFKAIQDAGLDPREFEFEDGDTQVRLKHKWSKSYFIFGSSDAMSYAARYVVGDESEWPYEEYSWQSLMRRVSNWLRDVKLDLDTPDLWAELQNEAELLRDASSGANENKPFTQQEQRDIEQRLREVETQVRRKYSLTEPEVEVLKAKIDYLVDAAGRLGRIDWRTIFVGTIVAYILSLSYASEREQRSLS
jgi:hypothetical protein